MKVQKIINIRLGKLLILLILLGFQSCYYDVVITEPDDISTSKSFSEDVLPVFRTSCISCHNGVITLPDLTEANAFNSLTLGNYLSVSDPENSILIQKMRSGHPFQGALAEGEIQQLIVWMSEGAKDN